MELNDDHIELLKKVRERMFDDAVENRQGARPYICWNIWLVRNEMELIPKERLFESLVAQEGNEEIRLIIAAIDSAINDCCTFANWLDDELKYTGVTTNLARAYTMGRIAWLDRMIETRVIA